jgi:hypothetical protein
MMERWQIDGRVHPMVVAVLWGKGKDVLNRPRDGAAKLDAVRDPSIITGVIMFNRPKKWREAHWAFNIGTLVLLFVTMLIGLGLDD